ncbi:LuxR C-terminal-related transcriptional regulator [Enterobacter cloacae]|uniref:LuxR C-terminal-related transcriptional regulator n=1 Tax=Enterobacter cloacae TaxID=550 RepID=UPI00317BFB3E
MKTKAFNSKVIIVGTCQYTSLGISSLFECCFYSKIAHYKNFSDINESCNELLTIAAIDENNITYNDIIYLKNRIMKNGGKNLIILSDTIWKNVLHSVFNITCLYRPRDISLTDLYSDIFNILLHDNNKEMYNSKPLLSGLESQILMMLCEGFTVSQISSIKKKSCKTISSHKCKMMKKLGMPNTPKSISVLSLYLKSITDSRQKYKSNVSIIKNKWR